MSTLISKFILFIYKQRFFVMIVLTLLTLISAYFYSLIRDNQSIYEMLNIKDPSDRYYVEHYAPDFGKDDFVYVAFKTPDPLGDQSFGLIHTIHELLENLEIHFDPNTGKLLWPQDPTRPLSEKIRHFLQPAMLQVTWAGDNGILKMTPAEMRKEKGKKISSLEVHKKLEDGKWVGVIKPVNFVVSLENSFVNDPKRLVPLAVTDARMLAGEPGELSKEEIENLLLESPLTGSTLISNIEKFNQTTGYETRNPRPSYTMVMAQLLDFRDRDSLRQAVLAKLRYELKKLENQTGSSFYLAGIPILNAETTRTIGNDHFQREPFILIIIALILVIIFRAQKRYILLPISVIFITLFWTLGLFKIYGGEFNWLTALLPVFLIVCSVSNSIHILRYYKKEGGAENNPLSHLKKVIGHVWKPCFLTSLTTMIGFLSLTFWKESLWAIKMFGFFGSLGLVISLIASFVCFALLLPFFPPPDSPTTLKKEKNNFWEYFLSGLFHFCQKRALLIVSLTGIITLISIYGITKIRADVDVKHYFKKEAPMSRSLDFIDDHYRGLGTYAITFEEQGKKIAKVVLPPLGSDTHSTPLQLTLGPKSLEAIQKTIACYRRFELPHTNLNCDWERFKLKNHQGRLTGSALSILDLVPNGLNANDPQVVLDQLGSMATQSEFANRMIRFFFSKDGTKTQVVRLAHAESAAPIKQVNDRIIKDLETFCNNSLQSSCVATFTGIGQVWNQFTQKLTTFLAKSFGAASLGVFLIMILFFLPRIDLGILSLIPNILPNLFILGAMGFLAIPLDMATAMVGSIALGLIVDDTIHFLHRFQIELKESNNFDHSVYNTLLSCGRAVIMTSMTLAAGFSILTLGNFVPVIQVGKLLMLIILCGVSFEVVLMPSLLFVFYKPLWHYFYEKKNRSRQPSSSTPLFTPES